MKRTLTLLFLLLTLTSALHAQTTISEKTADMELYEGFFDFWWMMPKVKSGWKSTNWMKKFFM